MTATCPFCSLPQDRIIAECESTVTIRDGYPVSDGHTLVIPKRHVESFFDCNSDEKAHIFQALEEIKVALDKEFSPDGYNIGINDGEAAGHPSARPSTRSGLAQGRNCDATRREPVERLHIHLIPRYKGDSEDPRGGVRWIFPEKAKYWSD